MSAANAAGRAATETPTPSTSVKAGPSNPKVTFYLGLKRRDAAAAKQVRVRSNPTSSQYRNWVSAPDVAIRYGASDATVGQVKKYLTNRGIRFALDKSRVFARVTAPAKRFEKVFRTKLQFQVEGGVRYVNASFENGGPKIPRALRPSIPDPVWFGVQQLSANARGAKTYRRARPLAITSPQNTGTPIDACATVANNPNVMTFGQAAKAYGIDTVRARLGYGKKKRTATPHIGIISMGSGFSQRAANRASKCLGWSAGPARVSKTDGMKTRLPEGGEGDLDQQMMSAMLGRTSRINTYEAINSDVASFLPFFSALNDRRRPPVLSVSYGDCEVGLRNRENGSTTNLSEAVLMRLALTGTSVFVASGDTGSSGCVESDQGIQLATSYPATSPYVTAVGGTRLSLTPQNQRADEVVWNDSDFIGGNYSLVPGSSLTGGGGGVSRLFNRPWWQTVRDRDGRRTVPDVTAHASGAPAWPVYFDTAVPIGSGTVGPGWVPVFGTSSSTPLTAAAFAMMAAKERAHGRPTFGLLNPRLYSLRAPYSGAFYDVVSGNNDLYEQGCCQAKKGYDQASGIGVPAFAKLQKQISSRVGK